MILHTNFDVAEQIASQVALPWHQDPQEIYHHRPAGDLPLLAGCPGPQNHRFLMRLHRLRKHNHQESISTRSHRRQDCLAKIIDTCCTG